MQTKWHANYSTRIAKSNSREIAAECGDVHLYRLFLPTIPQLFQLLSADIKLDRSGFLLGNGFVKLGLDCAQLKLRVFAIGHGSVEGRVRFVRNQLIVVHRGSKRGVGFSEGCNLIEEN